MKEGTKRKRIDSSRQRKSQSKGNDDQMWPRNDRSAYNVYNVKAISH
jgi:hypothetical protein